MWCNRVLSKLNICRLQLYCGWVNKSTISTITINPKIKFTDFIQKNVKFQHFHQLSILNLIIDNDNIFFKNIHEKCILCIKYNRLDILRMLFYYCPNIDATQLFETSIFLLVLR